VLRVPTDLGDVYFKANGTVQRHEVALVTLLAERRPDCIPALLACDLERGWMLIQDAGIPLRDLIGMERDMTRWLDVLPLYAGVQIDLAEDAEDLIALGTPDLRLARLPERYEQLLDQLDGLRPNELARLRGSVPRVADMCLELAGYGCRRRSSTTISTTSRSSFATAATSCSTGETPASHTRSSRCPSRSKA
jgi:hypothetical protein